jgi:MFS family permease
MRDIERTSPITVFFLVLPWGMSTGYVSVTLPFALTEEGVPVATTAAIVALGVSANLWRFLWGPLADLTLTLRLWYALGLVSASATLLLLGFMPLRDTAMLAAVVFMSQVAGTLIVLPVGGLMAHTVADDEKGRAAGWYQAGLVGGAAAGGVGVWLVDNFSLEVAGTAVATAMMICLAALYFVPAARGAAGARLGQRMREMGRDFRDMLRSPSVLLVIVLVSSPIGAGAANNLWSAVAPGWSATPNVVALVTGVLGALVGAVGCVVGGVMADRLGRWWVFFGSGVLIALVALVMAAAPRTPDVYSLGVLAYAFTFGLASAAFSAVILHAIGRGAASAKYAIVASLGNLPVVYMTAFDGWMYDSGGAVGMLAGEALLGIACVVLGLAAVWKVNGTTVRIPDREATG